MATNKLVEINWKAVEAGLLFIDKYVCSFLSMFRPNVKNNKLHLIKKNSLYYYGLWENNVFIVPRQ